MTRKASAEAYHSIAKEVLADAEKQLKRVAERADDIFSTEESRQEQQREQVQQIPIGELFPFKNHPLRSWTMSPCSARWKA